MALWVGTQRQANLVKNAKSIPLVTSPTKNPNPKLTIFLKDFTNP